MERSELAKQLFDTINIYSDFVKTGFTGENEDVDFSFLDKIEIIPEKESLPIQEEIIQQNEIDTNIKKESNLSKRKIIEIAEDILKCSNCLLSCNRKVPGAGNPNAKIFVINSFVDPDEEKFGLPLTGESLNFFKKWFEAIKINYDDLFVSHIIKCNPGKNRISKDAIESCFSHLDKQLEVVKPQIIFALGEFSLSSLCKKYMDMDLNHGKIFNYKGMDLISTYHPKDVLKNITLKKPVWDDLRKLQTYLQGKS